MKYFLITLVATVFGAIAGVYSYQDEIKDFQENAWCGTYIQPSLSESLMIWASMGVIVGLVISALARTLSANNEKHISLGLPNV